MDQVNRQSPPPTRIAIVDDDLRLARLVKTVLEETSQTNEVHVDADVVAAYDYISHIHPDLIILDIMMGVDPVGFETLHKLSSNPDMRRIPVVVSSAGMFTPDQYDEFKSPIVLLPKPFQLNELVEAVHQALLKTSIPGY